MTGGSFGSNTSRKRWIGEWRMLHPCGALFILQPLVTRHFICNLLLQDPLECTLMAALKQFKVNNNSCCVPVYLISHWIYPTDPLPRAVDLYPMYCAQCAVAGSYRARCLVLTCSRCLYGGCYYQAGERGGGIVACMGSNEQREACRPCQGLVTHPRPVWIMEPGGNYSF